MAVRCRTSITTTYYKAQKDMSKPSLDLYNFRYNSYKNKAIILFATWCISIKNVNS